MLTPEAHIRDRLGQGIPHNFQGKTTDQKHPNGSDSNDKLGGSWKNTIIPEFHYTLHEKVYLCGL
ncbi:hypothetical protein RvY_10969 [Ramazzottius varieornatus]|uniref:Uncharacterized protein n=1 Tax=Ramazzottius varieornatus TaxID=947166 RepID=A0A1D1VH01_RAMVA|nr:hypothetical protein RvY_10969 [Ramazzottius varieornatus]